MTGNWVRSTDISKQQSPIKQADMPDCSFCNQKPSHAGKLVAGPELFICWGCVKLAGEIFRETGFPIS